ncbi:Potassium voltage-gated channel subfamily B member 1 [Toxocara canis]|uniref:Potassium voltage-gated channel subfamily B member 1 n=1 Tax=Toxocara canis TaxID=6265 RepID=A0A0B2V974_TOXCA|nr:Potassium voltage-gated channel subfamily B member 1 [Toxocara canis]
MVRLDVMLTHLSGTSSVSGKIVEGAKQVNRKQANTDFTKGPSPRYDSTASRVGNETFSEDVEARLPSDRNLSHKRSVQATEVQDTILRLNIGGSSYRIRTRSIIKFGPMTLLGRFVRMNHEHRRQWADWYFEDSDEYFFERVPRYFDPIYDFYATGRLHVPKDLCFDKFMAELRYWAVSKSKMDDCCSPFAQYCVLPKAAMESSSFCESDVELADIRAHKRRAKSGQNGEFYENVVEKDHFIGLRCAKIRRKLWFVLEGQTSSRWWKAFEITSTSFVVLSITALILSSIPEFQVPERTREGSSVTQSPLTYPTYPKADGHTISSKTIVKNPGDTGHEMVEHPIFNYVENICVIYFTLEYVVRFWVAPRKWLFVKEFLNVIDLLAIAPFLFELVLIFVGISGENVRKVRWAFLTVRLLRVLRIVRIAKLGRFSPGLANFALTIKNSKKQMQMVAIVMLTVVIFFSTLVYFLEKDEPNTTFTSIPASFWWAVVTMSTVGYGDSVPQTIGLANFALTIKNSKKQMQMVAIVMLTVVIFFSTLVYFLEKDEPNTTFTSIPASFWWAVVTMSTVGYGDSVPQTIAGKLVGSGAIVCGVMVLALPITIMVNNFMQVVKLREEKIIKKYAQHHGDQESLQVDIRIAMRTDDDSEIEYAVVKQVASVTIESDSQTENGAFSLRSRRRKKRLMRRGPAEHMDIDVPSTAPLSNSPATNGKKSMEWDGVYSTSELSSSETYSSDGREADDEQSDFVDPTDIHVHDSHDPQASNGRQQRLSRAHTSLALLQRKLERFVRDDNQRELVLYQWIRSHQKFWLAERVDSKERRWALRRTSFPTSRLLLRSVLMGHVGPSLTRM